MSAEQENNHNKQANPNDRYHWYKENNMKFVKASLCLSIALAISACGEQASVGSHLNSAKNYLDQNKINESIIELKNAIRLDVKNGEARFLLGQIYLNLGDGLAAVKELERARRSKYSENKVLPLLARAYILTDNNSDVLALSTASKSLSVEAQSQYLAYQTLAALRSEQPEIAKQSVALAEKIAKQSQYSMLASAYLQLSENNNDEAKTLVARVLTINPKNVDAIMLQGQVAMLTKDYELAVDSFQQFTTLQPRFGMVQILLANAFLKAGELEEAEQYADAILEKVNSQPFAHYIKAMVGFEEKDFVKASKHAEAALASGFNQFNLKLVAGASAFYLKNWQQSHRHLSVVVKYLPTEHQARRMLAVTQLELGFIDEISATLAEFDGNNDGNSQFISSLSYKLLELGATGEVKKILAQNEESSAENAKNNARQGILKLMMNDPTGIEDLEDAIELNPEFIEAELALAFAALQNGDITKAKKIAEKWQQKYPDEAGSYNLLASIAVEEKKYPKAEQALLKSLAVEPDNLFALIEQLRIARIQKNEELSKQRVDNLIIVAPNNNKVLRHYFGIYRNDAALDKLKAAYELDTTDISKAVLLSEAMVSLGKANEAEKLLLSKTDIVPLPKRYWQLLVMIYKEQNDAEKVFTTLDRWQKENPYHIEPVVLLTDFYAGQLNYERALTVLKRGLDNHEDNLLLQLIQMQLLLNSQQIVPAKNLYKKLAVKDINKALKQGMLGRIFALEKNYEQAIPKLLELYKAYPSSQNAIHLTAAYVGNDDNARAAKVLEQHLEKEPNEYRIKTMLAGVYLESDANAAINVYTDVAEKQPKNFVAHNNLAWLYLQENDLENALLHAERAYELKPNIANIADTYGKVLLSTGDKRTALRYATRASEISQGKDIDIQLNYIETLIANNRTNEAKDKLSKLTTTTDEQKTKKAQLLTEL